MRALGIGLTYYLPYNVFISGSLGDVVPRLL